MLQELEITSTHEETCRCHMFPGVFKLNHISGLLQFHHCKEQCLFSFSKIFIGGFYSDTKAYVSESCLKCPNGAFVPYNKAPGKRARDCIACPQGNL